MAIEHLTVLRPRKVYPNVIGRDNVVDNSPGAPTVIELALQELTLDGTSVRPAQGLSGATHASEAY